MKIAWLRRARRSVLHIADYIGRDNPPAAAGVLEILRTAPEILLEYPHFGREGRYSGTRELIVTGTPYIIPYRISGDTIQILHVLHASQAWPGEF